jgi:hypothetical protein
MEISSFFIRKQNHFKNVIPAEAGIQLFSLLPRFRASVIIISFLCHSAQHFMIKMLLITLLLAAALPCRAAAVRNITDENRSILSDKVLELRQTELMRISRGRIKPNPIILSYFTIYQEMLMNQELLLATQLEEYKSALKHIQQARDDFRDFAATPLGAETARLFDARLIDAYTLKDKIAQAATLFELRWNLTLSGLRLQMLPVAYRMSLNTGAWLWRVNRGAPSAGATARYLEICRTPFTPAHIFDTDRLLNDLGRQFAAFFAGTVKETSQP